MLQLFVPALAALTSVGAYWLGRRVLGLTRSSLRPAVTRALQLVGMSVVFFLANLVVGLAVVAVVRGLTAGFLSVYLLSDVAGSPSSRSSRAWSSSAGEGPPPPVAATVKLALIASSDAGRASTLPGTIATAT